MRLQSIFTIKNFSVGSFGFYWLCYFDNEFGIVREKQGFSTFPVWISMQTKGGGLLGEVVKAGVGIRISASSY